MSEVIVEIVGSLGRIRLNRPKTLNAMTYGMIGSISAALERFETNRAVSAVLLTGEGERGLCAGGDLRALYDSVGTPFAEDFWREEYQLNYWISRYPKPYVVVMDGLTMGGGVGLSAHGSHRIVTERSKIAMPETGIGYLPDVGASWLLPKAPGAVGVYLGLTGAAMTAADAIYAGFADSFVPTQALPRVIEELAALPPRASADRVWDVIDRAATDPGQSSLFSHRATIDACFAQNEVADIFAALEADGSEFATKTLAVLGGKAPASLVLTLRLLHLGQSATSLKECLEREYQASLAMLNEGDFREGIRAAVIDKDRNPKWLNAAVADVPGEQIDRWLRPRARPIFAMSNAKGLVTATGSDSGRRRAETRFGVRSEPGPGETSGG